MEAATPIEDRIADIVYRLRRGDRMMIDWSNGFGSLIVGTTLEQEIADRLERSIGFRKVENDDGSVNHVSLSRIKD